MGALKYNSCLNRKIGIDSNGAIKNCPSSSKIFGNIKEDSIKSIISNPDFTKVWFLNRDQVNTCKVCEFRYMCTDCRVYSDGEYGKPAKCGYDPFTCDWKDDDFNKTKLNRKIQRT